MSPGLKSVRPSLTACSSKSLAYHGSALASNQVCWDTHLYHFPAPGEKWTSENNGLEQAKHLDCRDMFVCISLNAGHRIVN